MPPYKKQWAISVTCLYEAWDTSMLEEVLSTNRRCEMPLCGFNEKMLKGLVLYAQGLYEQVLKKAKENNLSTEQSLEREIHEMNIFLPALDEEYERLRKTMNVDEAMRALVQWDKKQER